MSKFPYRIMTVLILILFSMALPFPTKAQLLDATCIKNSGCEFQIRQAFRNINISHSKNTIIKVSKNRSAAVIIDYEFKRVDFLLSQLSTPCNADNYLTEFLLRAERNENPVNPFNLENILEQAAISTPPNLGLDCSLDIRLNNLVLAHSNKPSKFLTIVFSPLKLTAKKSDLVHIHAIPSERIDIAVKKHSRYKTILQSKNAIYSDGIALFFKNNEVISCVYLYGGPAKSISYPIINSKLKKMSESERVVSIGDKNSYFASSEDFLKFLKGTSRHLHSVRSPIISFC